MYEGPPIVDARSGRRVRVGDWVRYPPDLSAANPNEDDWKLLEVQSVGLFSAELLIGKPWPAGFPFPTQPGAMDVVPGVVRCPVRWFHPAGAGAARVILVPT